MAKRSGRTSGERSFASAYKSARKYAVSKYLKRDKGDAKYNAAFISNRGGNAKGGQKVAASKLTSAQLSQARTATRSDRNSAVKRYKAGERMSTRDRAVAIRTLYRQKGDTFHRANAGNIDALGMARKQAAEESKQLRQAAKQGDSGNDVRKFLRSMRASTVKRFGAMTYGEKRLSSRPRTYEQRYK